MTLALIELLRVSEVRRQRAQRAWTQARDLSERLKGELARSVQAWQDLVAERDASVAAALQAAGAAGFAAAEAQAALDHADALAGAIGRAATAQDALHQQSQAADRALLQARSQLARQEGRHDALERHQGLHQRRLTACGERRAEERVIDAFRSRRRPS